jgi:type IX secretion system PorP/SprF family membrane protein
VKKLLTILLISGGGLSAQQLQITSFYDQYGVMLNPATAGQADFIGGSFRSQWSSMPGAPQTSSLYGSVGFERSKTGLSGYLYNDITGPTRRTGLQVAYAYRIPMKKGTFSVGIEGRAQQFAVDAARFEQTVGGNDPVFASDKNQLKGDAGLGAAFTSKKYSIGLSVSQLIQSKLKWTSTSAQGRMYRHYFAGGYYHLQVDEATVITPHALAVYLPNSPTELQGGIRVEHDQTFWYGLGYRARQSWMLSAGVRIRKQFSVGYSFDMYRRPLSDFEGGSSAHEVNLRYDFRD